MLRILDFLLALTGLLVAFPLLLLLTIIGLFDTKKPFFLQKRVGRLQKPFTLVKFRSMRPDTTSVATHLVDASAITPFGRILRKTKLDELPQLWNVLVGQMSLVGPRPCLYNQVELIEERSRLNVFDARPGITGLAQIQEIDMSTPHLLAKTDARMLAELSLRTYFSFLFSTVTGKGSGDRVVEKGD